ncbi:MAG: amidohydrolase [Gemmatimonadaceae bacterium]
MFARSLLVAIVLAVPACTMSRRTDGDVTLAIVNAKVWTADPKRPWADAVAVAGERIAAVGSSAEIRKLAGQARVIDAKGAMVTPGFIDAHVHFIDGGFRLSSVLLKDAATPAEFTSRIKAFAATAPKGAWITGGDWDNERWGGELPSRAWIDSVTPDNPVWVNRYDGHMALANSLALKAAGVTAATKVVTGGTIVTDAAGAPTGVLKDNAMGLVDDVVSPPPPALEDRALDTAMAYVAAQGVTTVHNMGAASTQGSWHDLAVFRRAQAAGRLKTRIYAAVPLAAWAELRDSIAKEGRGDHWLRLGGLKGFVDGSLGSRTAAMYDAFDDAPGNKGFFVTPPETLYARISGADKAGLQVLVHAIGDRAIGTLLDIYARVEKENGPRDRRFRIEHVQHLAAADIPRLATLGVIASVQPYHAIDDGRFADKPLGKDRASRTYAFKSLLDAKTTLALGSDWFVAPPTPLEGIYAATTRRTLDDKNPNGWFPEQKIGVEDALRGYTINGAFASFEEKEKGSIEVGKLADLVLIDRDLTKIPPEQIREARVLMTIVGGQVVHETKP